MKSDYKLVCVGPGGRYCVCCAPPSQKLKRLEHRKARRAGKRRLKVLTDKMENGDAVG